MKKRRIKKILVTGAHRSGSTWVGNIIATSPGMLYFHEPFNLKIPVYNTPLKFWFQYTSEDLPEIQRNKVEVYLNKFIYRTKYPFLAGLFQKFPVLGELSLTLKGKKDLVIKDPLALFSAAWLSEKYDLEVVVLVRHPAAFIYSLMKKDWNFDFKNFLDQEVLMDKYLSRYVKQIELHASIETSVLEQGILLWNCLHLMIFNYKKRYKEEWLFVKHEDLSSDPENNFRILFDRLDLDFTQEVKEKINRTTTGSQKKFLTRDSKKNIKDWKENLRADQIDLIKKGTSEIWPYFYKEEDW
ncbi:sulfotransferase [Gramella lutea]|uniref:Sulfotransferase n=1 Tax=Christiangramia lutea TaxID=1607951 RepID=A0A9X1UZS5_9FLAO|nr:sulfotransferase domain-containing protein [Christiangramia lutea]MCH4821587.1 sulfotransferase [Christiangramia lutea]